MNSALLLALFAASPAAPIQAQSYADQVAVIERARSAMGRVYDGAETRVERRRLIEAARVFVLRALDDQIFPAWYGTAWAFSGRTARPGRGAIACGTFVGTVLEDAGFVLNRIKLGRLASEHIALSLTSERNLRRYSDRSASSVEAELKAWGPGLYAVGLDNHAGLIRVDARLVVRFVHSSYYGRGGVQRETLTSDNPFAFSRYRVLAKLLDDAMIAKWLRAEPFEAKKPPRRRQSALHPSL